MNTHRSIAGAWAGGLLITLLLASNAPAALWLVLILLLALAVTIAPDRQTD